MRILPATIGALLITVSHTALAQEQPVLPGEAPAVQHGCSVDAPELTQMQSTATEPREVTAAELVAQLPDRPVTGQMG